MKQNMPILFDTKYSDLNTDIDIIETFIYHCTGESQANGQYYLKYYDLTKSFDQIFFALPLNENLKLLLTHLVNRNRVNS